MPPLLNFSLRHCADVMTFFAVHLNLSGKLDICRRAALGFKIFSNAAFRVNIIAHPCDTLRSFPITSYHFSTTILNFTINLMSLHPLNLAFFLFTVFF